MTIPTSSCWWPIHRFTAQTVSATTRTAQVAPTILKALGLDPQALDAVRAEGTQVLPEVGAQLAK